MTEVEYPVKLHPVLTKEKRIKIIVGGRASGKSVTVSDYVSAKMSAGELWCCARENQNSIEESVHRTLLDEIERLGIDGFEDTKTAITHISGGRCFYRGLARNITSLKSTLSGIDGLWIEEGEDISANTLRVLTASVRLSAADTVKKLAGEEVKLPEIIITMNRGARTGAIAQKWLKRAEPELARCGYYEDDTIMVVQINYNDLPKKWFLASGLEQERLDDLENLTTAAYNHKWLGHYLDEVEDSIIKPEWFQACLDAHKDPEIAHLFRDYGLTIAAHDPSGMGKDDKGFAVTKGSVVQCVKSMSHGDVDEGCDWALGEAVRHRADYFIYDADGMGAGLKGQVSDALKDTGVMYHPFRGSLSGKGQDNGTQSYQHRFDDKSHNPKTYADTFLNNRAQYYIELARRMRMTYRARTRGEYCDVKDLVSFDSAGVENLDMLQSELCRVPRKHNSRGLDQIMSKQEMAANGIESPNMADAVMMSMWLPRDEQGHISTQEVEESRRRSGIIYNGVDPLICGISAAVSDDATTVVQLRRGRDAACENVYLIPGVKSRRQDWLVENLGAIFHRHKPDAVFIDVKIGPVIDRIYQLGYTVVPVNPESTANNKTRYANKLSEMAARCREWLVNNARIPDNDKLEFELSNRETGYTNSNQFKIESSTKFRERTGQYCDWANALYLTFAQDVPNRRRGDFDNLPGQRRVKSINDVDPIARYEKELSGE